MDLTHLIPNGGDALVLGLRIFQEIEAIASLQNPGDKEELMAIHTRLRGKKLKVCVTVEVEA
jgi:hypothetical protein